MLVNRGAYNVKKKSELSDFLIFSLFRVFWYLLERFYWLNLLGTKCVLSALGMLTLRNSLTWYVHICKLFLTKLKYILTELALEIIDDDQGVCKGLLKLFHIELFYFENFSKSQTLVVLFEASSGKTLKQIAELIQKNENHPAKDNFLVQEIVKSKVQPTQWKTYFIWFKKPINQIMFIYSHEFSISAKKVISECQ